MGPLAYCIDAFQRSTYALLIETSIIAVLLTDKLINDRPHTITVSIFKEKYNEMEDVFKMNDNMMHEIKYLIGIPVPTGSPDLVESVRLNNSALAIRWKPPVLRQQNGAMLGYQVLY